ncbi:MAG: hypothetical protein ACM3H8_04010, partial [Sphingobacteriales bacterium]
KVFVAVEGQEVKSFYTFTEDLEKFCESAVWHIITPGRRLWVKRYMPYVCKKKSLMLILNLIHIKELKRCLCKGRLIYPCSEI